MMSEIAEMPTILLALGGMFLLGLVADLAGRHTPFPRVTLLLLAGRSCRYFLKFKPGNEMCPKI